MTQRAVISGITATHPQTVTLSSIHGLIAGNELPESKQLFISWAAWPLARRRTGRRAAIRPPAGESPNYARGCRLPRADGHRSAQPEPPPFQGLAAPGRLGAGRSATSRPPGRLRVVEQVLQLRRHLRRPCRRRLRSAPGCSPSRPTGSCGQDSSTPSKTGTSAARMIERDLAGRRHLRGMADQAEAGDVGAGVHAVDRRQRLGRGAVQRAHRRRRASIDQRRCGADRT